jgi:hypothetical protein
MALQDFLQLPADQNGNVTPEQINQAFRDVYGIDAPPQIIYDFAGKVGAGPHFYERVSKGDFAQDIQKRDPNYFQQAQVAQLANQQIAMNKQAYAPLIPSLEQSKTSLQSRYDAILGDLTNRETTDVNNITKSTSAEFAKRGIMPSSDAYTRELAMQLNPIHSQYGTQRATQSAELGGQLNTIDQAIASLKAGKPDVAIPAGNQLASSNPSGINPTQTGLNYQNVTVPAAQASLTSQKYQDLTSLIKQAQGLA